MGGWVGGWMGWVDVGAELRIAYSNQKFKKVWDIMSNTARIEKKFS